MWESRFQRSNEVHHEMGDRPLCKSTEETFEAAAASCMRIPQTVAAVRLSEWLGAIAADEVFCEVNV